VGTFFSGGVDSFYTLLSHQEEISHLCLIYGMDIPLENTRYREDLSVRVREVGNRQGKEVIEVETNIAHFLDVFVPWQIWYGALLRTTAILLNGFTKFYVPSSYFGANLFPDGTHPILDPLWSTQRLAFAHHGCQLTRFRKTEFVSRYPIVHDYLRVCWEIQSATHNCCQCEKCIRTMIYLQAVDQLEEFSVFPKPLDLSRYPRVKLKPIALSDFYQPTYDYLKETGKHPDLLKYLERMLFPSWWERWYKHYSELRKYIRRNIRDYVRRLFGKKQTVKPSIRKTNAMIERT
jgi:hypothetical protein